MFSSSGYFHGAYCPFYQHGLCHRPYCHFKHAIKPGPQLKTEQSAVQNGRVKNKIETEDDPIMKIVKSVPQTNLLEQVRKRQEDEELRRTLDKIDKENKAQLGPISIQANHKATSLIDAFYHNTGRVIGTFTSHASLNEDHSTKKKEKVRRICECDDPDCCGFIEESDEEEEIKDRKIEDENDVSEKENSKDKLSNIDFFGSFDQEKEEKIVKKTKNKKKKKKAEPQQEEEEFAKKSKKRKSDAKEGEEQSKKNKKSKQIDDKYEMVFLPEIESEDIEEAVENTRQSEVIVSLKDNDYISTDSIAKTGQGSSKKRVAHSKEEVMRTNVKKLPKASVAGKLKKLSYISPGLAAPVLTSQSTASASPKVDVPASMGFTTEEGIYVGRKRVAHASSTSSATKASTVAKTTTKTAEVKVVRPKLVMEVGGKVPHMLRQKYLDKIIDELTPKCATEKEAIEKGFEEEKMANQRSTRKQIYMNLCANIIKKIRTMPDYVHEEANATALNPMVSGTPTVQGISRLKSSSTSGYKKVSSQSGLTRTTVKPVSSSLLASASSKPVGNTIKERRSSIEPIQLTEETFYNYLQKFLLNDGQLWENGYPRKNSTDSSIIEVKDYTATDNTLRRTCCRCGKEYFMNKKGKYITKEECRYHWGKLRKRREARTVISYFSCCQAVDNAEPCSFGRLHVCNRVGPLTDYVCTSQWQNEETKRKIFSIDCEMCYTTQGLELTRVTVVDFYLAQIIDLFVKPENPIVDYNTKFSGVTKENLKNVDYSLKDIQEIFMNLFDKDTILMGHSLESDLKALKIIHRKVIDTALVFPHRLGLPFKRALKTLMAELLHKIIQDGEGGHDSCEDARACMELMKYKFNEDLKAINRTNKQSHNITSSSFYSRN